MSVAARRSSRRSSVKYREDTPDVNDSDSDFEADDKPRKTQKKKKMTTNKRSAAAAAASEKAMPATTASMPLSQLNLSESESEDDDDFEEVNGNVVPPEAVSKLKPPSDKKKKWKKSPMKKKNEQPTSVLMDLENLATFANEDVWTRANGSSNSPVKKLDFGESAKDVKKATEELDRDVAELLKMGEVDKGDDAETEEEEEEEEEEKEMAIKTEEPSVSTSGVEVTVRAPDNQQSQKKRKSFDVEAYVKRQIGKARRETQAAVHKSHVLCLIGHLRHVSGQVLVARTAQAAALSVVPTAHAWSQADLTKPRLAAFLTWFRSAIAVREDFGRADDFPFPLEAHFLRLLAAGKAESDEDLVLLFLLITRALQWENCRLVLNLETAPLKPPADDDPSAPTAKRRRSSAEMEANETDAKTKSASKASSKCSRASSKNKSSGKSTGKAGSGSRSRDMATPDSKIASKRSSEKQPEKGRSRTRTTANDSDSSRDRSRRSETRGTKSSTPAEKKKSSKRSSTRAESTSGKGKRRSPREDPDWDSDEPAKSAKKTRKTAQDSSKASTRKEPKASATKASSPEKLSCKALEEAGRRRSSRARPVAPLRATGSDDEGSSHSSAAGGKKKTKSTKQKVNGESRKPVNYWVEVLVRNEYVCVDVVRGRSDCASDMKERASKPMHYVLACTVDTRRSIKDVSLRYIKDFLSDARKKRVDQAWLDGALGSELLRPADAARDAEEDRQLARMVESEPLPTSVGAFKGHPLYVLERHLLKFEAIYPPEPPPQGYIRGEPVYARECVHTLRSRETWLKEGRVVRTGESAYKVVKGRPKWDRMTGTIISGQDLDVFGHWQTDLYVAPPAKDGKVPRNEYGNVELFKPWMLPKGAVHLPLQGLGRIAKKLGVDCAPAMVGWDFNNYGCRPMYDGFVVCEEFKETLLDAWNTDVEERARKSEEKREKRILHNWEKLARGLLIAQKVKKKYAKK